MKRDISPKKAFFQILVSVIIVLSLATLGIIIYKYVLELKKQNTDYNIEAILQTGPTKEALSSQYLAELMDLSGDEKCNIYCFSTQAAKKKLLTSPLIKRAYVKKIYPSTIYVDYTARFPSALLYDYLNTAIDDEGYIFPITPFFTPKKLPEVNLGLMPFGYEEDEYGTKGASWNEPIKSEKVKLAFAIIDLFTNQTDIELLRVDVSSAFSDSWGRREIVLVINDTNHLNHEDKMITFVFPRILRLNASTYEESLAKYYIIRSHLMNEAIKSITLKSCPSKCKMQGLILDLRIEDLAYVQ
jgi:hypothetical protein